MPTIRVILLPGIVLPAGLAYGALLNALAPDVEDVAKDCRCESDTAIEISRRRHRHAGPASPGAACMRSWSRDMDADDRIRSVACRGTPHRASRMARTCIDTVEERARCETVEPFGMLPHRAGWFVAGKSRYVQEPG